MGCVSLCKKRRPLVWSKGEGKFLFSSQFLVSYFPAFQQTKYVSKRILPEIRCGGENGIGREAPDRKEIAHVEEGGHAR